MTLNIQKNRFEGLAGALREIAKTGFWPTPFVSSPSRELPIHHHDVDIQGYLISGHTYILDEKGQRHDVGPGDKLVLPAGTRHAEDKTTESVTYIVTVSDTRPLGEALALLGLD